MNGSDVLRTVGSASEINCRNNGLPFHEIVIRGRGQLITNTRSVIEKVTKCDASGVRRSWAAHPAVREARAIMTLAAAA